MAREQGTPLSRLPAELPPRFTASDRLQDFPVEASRRLIERLAASGEALAEFLGPLALRPAGIDRTDGLRVTLESGEIVHLRPSGNAPELRCYAEAATQARAGQLALACLARVREWRG
jgi:phosphomannomutase